MENLEKIEQNNSEILISNPEELQKKIRKFQEGGVETTHILADFDKTLTKASMGKEGFKSVISLLRDGNHLTPDYAPRAHALFDEYHPIEINYSLPLEYRKEKMNEWWNKHFALLIECGLEKKDLEDIVDNGKIQFRDGAKNLIETLETKNIPLVIISSNVVGNTIPMIFEKDKMTSENIHVITNIFEWDDEGRAVKVREPFIHSLNKSEVAIKDYPVYEKVKNRKNVILLGDSLDDIGMVDGFDYDEIIKIGFLNENVEGNKRQYLDRFDAVITNDGDMSYVNSLIEKII